MLQIIDPTKKKITPKYYISKPDKTIIGVLDVYNDTYQKKLGSINELNFSVSLMREINHEQVINPSFTKIYDLYLVKMVLGKETEWFIINNIQKSMSDNGDAKIVHAFSLAYELSYRTITDYKVEAFTPSQVFANALDGTNWSIGTIDDIFSTRYRSLDISGTTTVLDLLNQAAIAYQGLLDFDTVNRKVSLLDPDAIQNKGLRFSYGNLLQGVTETFDSDAMVTRLIPRGKEGLTIESVNGCGTPWIEDFTFFMRPEYMSQGLITALQNYSALVKTKNGEFASLLSQLSTLQETLTTQQNTLDDLNTDLLSIQDNIDVNKQTNQSTTTLETQKASKQAEINAQNQLIATTNTSISNIENQITALRNLLAIENNFTSEQITERNNFIHQKEWVNENFYDVNDLYSQSIIEFNKMREPAISIKIDVVNFLEILTEQKKWDLLVLGDIVNIYHEKLDINIQARLTEINYDFANDSITLTIANAKTVLSDTEKFVRDMAQSKTTSTTVTSNSPDWNSALQAGNGIVSNGKNQIVEINTGGSDGVVVKSEDGKTQLKDKGLSVFNITGLKELLKLGDVSDNQDGTNYGFVGRDLSGNELFRLDKTGLLISSLDGNTRLEGKGLIVYDSNGNERVRLGDNSPNKDGSSFGLTVYNDRGEVVFTNNSQLSHDTIQLADNVDSAHKLKLKIYVDDDVIEVRKVKLAFSLEKFRAYETGASSGGASTQTSSSGGGGTTTSGASSTSTSASGGGSVESASDDTRFAMNLATTYPRDSSDPFETHDHAVTIPQITHNHTVTIPEHYHSISHNHSVSFNNHDHSVNLPDHQHGIIYGIYEDTVASNVDVYVDGTLKLNNSGSHYNSDQNNLDLTPFIQTPGWHTVELSSATLGRLNASLYLKSYIAI